MSTEPAVAKTVWTEADFDAMGDGPWLSVEDRGGFSFARESYSR